MSDLRTFENAADAADSIVTKGTDGALEDGHGNILNSVKVSSYKSNQSFTVEAYRTVTVSGGGLSFLFELDGSARNGISAIIHAVATDVATNNVADHENGYFQAYLFQRVAGSGSGTRISSINNDGLPTPSVSAVGDSQVRIDVTQGLPNGGSLAVKLDILSNDSSSEGIRVSLNSVSDI